MTNIRNIVGFLLPSLLVMLAAASSPLTTAARASAAVAAGGRHGMEIRPHHEHTVKRVSDQVGLGFRAVCIPTTSQTLEDHEGRHKCAYDHPNGFRAVGVGYNLDDDVATRRTELSVLFADYDKVYSNESCLWDIQITTLLALDARRALDNAAQVVLPLDGFCCEVMAVFADVQHSLNVSSSFPYEDLKVVIEKAAAKEWKEAAQELNGTAWCNSNPERCSGDFATVKGGCTSSSSTIKTFQLVGNI